MGGRHSVAHAASIAKLYRAPGGSAPPPDRGTVPVMTDDERAEYYREVFAGRIADGRRVRARFAAGSGPSVASERPMPELRFTGMPGIAADGSYAIPAAEVAAALARATRNGNV
jgi:hypothetical protein